MVIADSGIGTKLESTIPRPEILLTEVWLGTRKMEWEKEGHYPQEIIEQGIEMGLHMLQVPEEYGGMGLDTTTTAMMIEEGAKVESTFMGMFNVTSMGGKIVMAAGNDIL